MVLFHTKIGAALADPSTWASITAALAAALVYAPESWRTYIGGAAAVASFLGVMLKGGGGNASGPAQ